MCHQMKVRPLSPPVIELSQNTGLLLDNTLIHIPDSDTPPPTGIDNSNQVGLYRSNIIIFSCKLVYIGLSE